MTDTAIKLLAQWATDGGCHLYNDPNLSFLHGLDDIRKKVYEENRIKAPGGFQEASRIAFEAVVRKVIEIDTQVDKILIK